MPYSTSQSNGMSQAANALAKIFVGDPAADAEYRNQQIKNETEFLRQQQIHENILTEAVQRKQLEASAAAANALASSRSRENNAYKNLGNLFTQDFRDFSTPGGQSTVGDLPAGTPGAGFDINNPAISSKILSNIMTGGIDPKVLSSLAIMPGQSDNSLSRILVGSGTPIGKDDYVSIEDRNKNRNYELGASERLVGGQGNVITGIDPSYADTQAALTNQRNATARRQDAAAKSGGAGGKIPRLAQSDLNSMLRNAIMTRGAQLPKDDKGNFSIGAAEYLSGQPELYADMSRVVDEAYRLSGGRASAVQDALSQYLNGIDFSQFRTTAPGGVFTGWGDGKWSGETVINPVQRPDVNAVLEWIKQNYGPGISPEIFTEGGEADLQNLQNVGNMGGWQILGVQ